MERSYIGSDDLKIVSNIDAIHVKGDLKKNEFKSTQNYHLLKYVYQFGLRRAKDQQICSLFCEQVLLLLLFQ